MIFSSSDAELQPYQSWYNLRKYYPNTNLLLAIIPGHVGEKIEKQDISLTTRQAMACLRTMFGDSIPSPKDVKINSWWSNPLTLGAYSNVFPGFQVDHINELSRPDNNLYLSGEIFGWPNNGYVHTAFIAGKNTANSILSHMRNSIDQDSSSSKL